ncbi:MAG: metallophosphoesterase [Chloroflexi bacterium]|nr:metallophosphoesterase [Chloroflexota bacterium]
MKGAGDIVACGSSNAIATAALLDSIAGTIFTLGDNVYPDATTTEFRDCFDPTWGRQKARMLPVIGNHEYNTAGAAGYFGYFGAAAAGPGGYYAVDQGTWRVYAINSECSFVPCGAASAQLSWLQADLAANPRQCVLAMWHEPRFTSGVHGDATAMAPIWAALHAAGAELVLSGHDHDYERLLPMDPSGTYDPGHGVIQMVVGTGGVGNNAFPGVRANSVVRNDSTYGVIQLTLRPGGWDWHFLPVPGGSFTDSGSASCHDAP